MLHALGLPIIHCHRTLRLKRTTMVLLLPTVFCWVGIQRGLVWTVVAQALKWGCSQLVAGVGMADSGASEGWPSISLNPQGLRSSPCALSTQLVGLPYCTAASGQTGYFPQGCLPSEGASQESRADRHGPDLIQRLHFQQYCFDHWTQSCLRSLIQFEFIFVHGVS